MKTRILITVDGGNVQSVCTNNPDIEVYLTDYDNPSHGLYLHQTFAEKEFDTVLAKDEKEIEEQGGDV